MAFDGDSENWKILDQELQRERERERERERVRERELIVIMDNKKKCVRER